MQSGSIRRTGYGSGFTTQRDQRAIGEQDLEESGCGRKKNQPVTMQDVLTRLAPKQSISILPTFLAMELPLTMEWEAYEQACRLAVSLNHHFFDNLCHGVALQSSNAVLITAETQYFRKATSLGTSSI